MMLKIKMVMVKVGMCSLEATVKSRKEWRKHSVPQALFDKSGFLLTL